MFIMGIPAVLALMGLLCGYFAEVSGRDPYAWFLMGSLMGPVGFFVLFMPPLRLAGILCPACDQVIHTDDIFCRYCGVRLDDSSPVVDYDSM